MLIISFFYRTPNFFRKFCFYIFDKDKNGNIEEDELHTLVEVLQSTGQGQFYSNTKQALLGAFDADGDGKMSFPEFCALHKKYPQMLHPAFRMQDSIMAATMGRDWWINRRALFAEERMKIAKDEKKAKEREKKKLVDNQKKQIRRKMGYVQYYLNCSKRQKYLNKLQSDAEEEQAAREQRKKRESERRAAEEAERLLQAERSKLKDTVTLVKQPSKPHLTTDSRGGRSKQKDRADRRKKRQSRLDGGSGSGSKKKKKKVKKLKKIRDA